MKARRATASLPCPVQNRTGTVGHFSFTAAMKARPSMPGIS